GSDDVPAVRRILPREFEAQAAVGASDEDCRHGSVLMARSIIAGAEEMQRHIGLLADYPAIVPRWVRRDVEDVAGAHLDHASILDRGRGAARHDQPDMFDLA